VVQLNRLEWRDYAQRSNPLAAALMARMHRTAREKPTVLRHALELLASLKVSPAHEYILGQFLEAYLPLTPPEKATVQAEINRLPPEKKEKTMAKAMGFFGEGKLQATQELVCRLLRKRLGGLDTATEARVTALTLPRLEQLSEALLDFTGPGLNLNSAVPGSNSDSPPTPDTFWALKDVSFEVKRGEVVGVIGRNGAGKSTLLKILSRITEPTTGSVTLHGRVGSLLEVGTGFHPELTGRENVFLNGAILGMKRSEIAAKFDEIVAFAEVEKFLDTPVKHYSSGMYMRLAFAVAAHLEPEILIVDEVLAVGDAGFQKKCLGKMGEVAQEGRTVLFVSHNMQAVSQLTTRAIFLESGSIRYDGATAAGLTRYKNEIFGLGILGKEYTAPSNADGDHLARVSILTSESFGEHICGRPITFEFDLSISEAREGICFSFQVVDREHRPVCYFWLFDRSNDFCKKTGLFRFRCIVPRFRLYMGRYTLTTWLTDRRSNVMLEKLTDICLFEITMRGIPREEYDWQPDTTVYLEDGEWSLVEQIKSK
jgi:lipopolysaccharide transport system ATP-binding protein